MKPITEVYTIESCLELISGEDLNNKYRVDINNKIESMMADLHIVTINIDSYKVITSENGNNLRILSPSFVHSFIYSSVCTNILIMSNFFDKNKKVLSLYKLVNCIECNKNHLECRLLERRIKKDIDWKIVYDGLLQKQIKKWQTKIESMRGTIVSKIDTLRDRLYAHKDISFLNSKLDNAFSIEEFEIFVQEIFDFINDINASLFYTEYAFFEHSHPDIEQTLSMVNDYRKYKKDLLTLIRNGVLSKENK